MSPPGFASVVSFILSQGAKGSGFNICLYLAFPLSPFILSQSEKGGDFNICLYLALPLSLHSSYGKVRNGGGFNVCLYLAFPLSHPSFGKVKKGVISTCVPTWLCLCHSSCGKVRRGGGFNVCLYLAFPLSPFILSQGETGGGFDICLYLAFPLSLHSSYRKVRSGEQEYSPKLYKAPARMLPKRAVNTSMCTFPDSLPARSQHAPRSFPTRPSSILNTRALNTP